jgi:hypothetical protein
MKKSLHNSNNLNPNLYHNLCPNQKNKNTALGEDKVIMVVLICGSRW